MIDGNELYEMLGRMDERQRSRTFGEIFCNDGDLGRQVKEELRDSHDEPEWEDAIDGLDDDEILDEIRNTDLPFDEDDLFHHIVENVESTIQWDHPELSGDEQ